MKFQLAAVLTLAAVVVSNATAATPATNRGQRIADHAQLRLSDLPPGWRSANNPAGGGADMSRCFASPSLFAVPQAMSERVFLNSMVFGMAGGVVFIVDSPVEAQHVFAGLRSERVWECFARALKKDDPRTRKIELAHYSPQDVGAPAFGREIRGTFETRGIQATVYLHFDLAWKGRAVVAVVSAGAFSPPFTLGEESSLLRRVLSRLP
jgi:hypothetical protein